MSFHVFLITTLTIICKSCLEKSSNDWNKIYQLFGRTPYNPYSIFRKHLKIWHCWFQGRRLSWGSTLANLHAVSQRPFQKSPTTVFFNLVNFPRIDIKSNSWRIAQKIFCKKVKQVLQSSGGETGVATELQKKSKWTITKILL